MIDGFVLFGGLVDRCSLPLMANLHRCLDAAIHCYRSGLGALGEI